MEWELITNPKRLLEDNDKVVKRIKDYQLRLETVSFLLGVPNGEKQQAVTVTGLTCDPLSESDARPRASALYIDNIRTYFGIP